MYIVRKVLPNEYHKYRKHLKSLDTASRNLRFANPVSNEVIDHLCDKFESHPTDHVLFAIEDDLLDFVAVGHVSLEGDMELAFSVLKEHQGKGMGSALMQRILQHCRTTGHLKGHMVCLPHNTAIKHLCTKYGIQFHTEYGETEGDIELPKASVSTFIDEATSRNLGALDFMAKRSMLPWTILSH